MHYYFEALFQQKYARPALTTALVVGSCLFLINHGAALLNSEMTAGRWLSGTLTYLVPYAVHVYGQITANKRK